MYLIINNSTFTTSLAKIQKCLLDFKDNNNHTLDLTPSTTLLFGEFKIPEYLDVILKINNMEFDTMRFHSPTVVDDHVTFVYTEKSITTNAMERTVLDLIVNCKY